MLSTRSVPFSELAPQVVKESQLPSLPCPSNPPRVTSTTPQPLKSSWTPLSTTVPKGAGICTRITGLVACNRQRRALLPGRGPLPLPSRSQDRTRSHPSTQNKMTNRSKQTETEESHPGWRGRTEAPPGGRGVHLINASGPGRGRWKREGKGRDEGHGRRLREEGERAVMQLGTNLLLLYQILSQSIGVC